MWTFLSCYPVRPSCRLNLLHDRLPEGGRTKIITPEMLTEVDLAILRALFKSDDEMRRSLGAEYHKTLQQKCMADHSKPEARQELEDVWIEWMKMKHSVPMRGRGRWSDPMAHVMMKHITAPDTTGRRTAKAQEYEASVGLAD